MKFGLEIEAEDKFHQSSFGYKFKVQTGAVPHNYDRLIIHNQPNYHGRHLSVGSATHKAAGCRL
jgi:hypothetical protein